MTVGEFVHIYKLAGIHTSSVNIDNLLPTREQLPRHKNGPKLQENLTFSQILDNQKNQRMNQLDIIFRTIKSIVSLLNHFGYSCHIASTICYKNYLMLIMNEDS